MEFRRGQTLLSLTILIGGIVLVTGTALAVMTASFVSSGFGYQAAQQAEAGASAAVQDALLQLARNPSFSSTGYSLTVGSSTATVVVTQNSPSSGFVTVLASCTISFWTRHINVVLTKNTTTGQLTLVSSNEVQ